MSGRADLSAAQRALLAQRLRGRRVAAPEHRFAPFSRAGNKSAPLSAEQEQMLYHCLFVPGNPLYNEAITIVKEGPLDLGRLRAAFNEFVARHDIWHTTFTRVDHVWRQVVGPPIEFDLPLHDLSALPAEEREVAAATIVSEQTLAPYDLKRGPMVRPVLVRFDADHHRLYVALHHIIFDGVSLYRVVLPELVALYEAALVGKPSPLAPAVQYADYAVWEHEGVLDEELRRHLPYWREHLAGAPTLNLPLARARPTEPRFHGTTEWFTVSADLVARLKRYGTSVDSTLFHVLVGAFAVLLQKYTGDEDILFSTVADLRRRHEFESMVGYCLTPIPLRLRFDAATPFSQLVKQVRGELLDGLSHLVPFERIVRDLNPPHPTGANPVFQAQIVLEPPTVPTHPEWSLHMLDERIGSDLGHAKTDFHMELDQRPEGHLSGRFIFNTELFDDQFGARVAADWQALLRRLVPSSSV